MARHLLSDKALRAIKPGDPRARLSDGGGLYLLLFVKGGSHGWRLAYSHAGRRNVLSLGTYPAVSLAEARRKAEAARDLLQQGIDPSAHRKAAKAAVRRRACRRTAHTGPRCGPGRTFPGRPSS